MPSNYKFTENGVVRNFDDIFVTRDSFDSTSVGGPGNFTVSGQDIEDYFIDDQSVIDNFIGDTLWAWGNGANGQNGTNNTSTVYTPVTTFLGGTNWKQVSVVTHTAAIKTDGTLWTWGRNTYGQLGINNATTKNTPVTTFLGGTNWKQVSCGGRTTTMGFTAAIKTDGTLWTWGRNSYGTLGINNTTNKLTPVTTFLGGTNWRQVSCGLGHVAAIKTDGTLWTWGRNAYGQLGIGVAGTSTNRTTPVQIGTATNWKDISCGREHTLAVKTDGTLWVWGRNNTRQLGLGSGVTANQNAPQQLGTAKTWKKVSGGVDHSAAIKTDGTLWLWGGGGNGELGNFYTTTNPARSTPVTTFLGGTNWKQVELGYRFSAAIKTDGTLWTWGSQSLGSGNLGINVSGGSRSSPVTTFAGGNNWKQVAAGEYTTVAVKSGINIDLS
jgi:alpha-tubulin suppressor-like RCC1 family protein